MADRYEAVIFDMDGVVTDTAVVHFRGLAASFSTSTSEAATPGR